MSFPSVVIICVIAALFVLAMTTAFDNPFGASTVRAPRAAWLLLPVPFGICAGLQYSSLLIHRIGILHLLMIQMLPFAFGTAVAVLLSMYLVRAGWCRVLIAAYVAAMFLMSTAIARTFPNPFP